MHKQSLIAAMSFSFYFAPATANTYSDLNTPDQSGYMWGKVYQQTKAACGALPQDLEDDYAKAIRLLSQASPEFAPTYQDGLRPSLKKDSPRSVEELEDLCIKGQVGLRTQVKLARYWFSAKW
ncbi:MULTISPECIES: hypothetical protein [Pseudomonas]|uniref:Lipoprotein n=1 Tax=Pseudomonas fluorescens (strain Q2-87) TaxID=1038922 RepID=J2ED67_PSEFQ|nr:MULTISPECIES: hypothetical protein [Pseudomonas]EJL01220.1 hypothetical protein PflQ2_1754 [Pseudomonas fluorescens Q2-87]